MPIYCKKKRLIWKDTFRIWGKESNMSHFISSEKWKTNSSREKCGMEESVNVADLGKM